MKPTRRMNKVPLPTCQSYPSSAQRCSATIDNITMTKTKSNHQAALIAIEKVLTLLRSVQTLEGTDKDGVEHLLEMAVKSLREK